MVFSSSISISALLWYTMSGLKKAAPFASLTREHFFLLSLLLVSLFLARFMQIEREHEFAIQQFNAILVKLCLWHFLLKSVALVIGHLHASPVSSAAVLVLLLPLVRLLLLLAVVAVMASSSATSESITTIRQWRTEERSLSESTSLTCGSLDDILCACCSCTDDSRHCTVLAI